MTEKIEPNKLNEQDLPEKLPTLTCKRCGHQWIPRTYQKPRICPNPNCRSPYWDTPRTRPYTRKGQPKKFAAQQAQEARSPVIGMSEQDTEQGDTPNKESEKPSKGVTDRAQKVPLIEPAPGRKA